MLYRLLIFIICIEILFIPVYFIVNWIYKRIHIINETSDLKDEYERNKNSKKIIEQEISNKIKDLKIEQEKLKNIKK